MCILIIACVIAATGKYPIPSGDGIEIQDESIAKIDLPDYSVKVQIHGYAADIGLVGFVVPVIPIGQWEWLTGIGKDDLRITTNLTFLPKTNTGQFDPGTLRIVVNGKEYVPTEIKKAKHCVWDRDAVNLDKTKSIRIDEQMCIWFKFNNLQPPNQPFSVKAKDLPIIEYTLERSTSGDFIR